MKYLVMNSHTIESYLLHTQINYLSKSTDTTIKYYSSKIIIRPIHFQNDLSKSTNVINF